MKNRAYQISEEQFKHVIESSDYRAQAMRKLGYYCVSGKSYVMVQKRIEELGINTDHWKKYFNDKPFKAIPINEYFVKDTKRNGSATRLKILKNQLLSYKCSVCGNEGCWNGKELVLQIDHINGDHCDNRLENLRFICPNCHSQTKNFAGKNSSQKARRKRKCYCKNCGKEISRRNISCLCIECLGLKHRVIERPSKDVLLKEIATSSYVAVAKKYGVTDNAIRKWCKFYGLPLEKKELKKMNNEK